MHWRKVFGVESFLRRESTHFFCARWKKVSSLLDFVWNNIGLFLNFFKILDSLVKLKWRPDPRTCVYNRPPPPRQFDSLPTPKGSPFCIFFCDIYYWWPTLKSFLKSPSALQYMLNLSDGVQKNAIFWSKISKKLPIKRLFLAFFFTTFCLRHRNLFKWRSLQWYMRARKISLVDLKKSAKFSQFFWKSAPLTLDPPLNTSNLCISTLLLYKAILSSRVFDHFCSFFLISATIMHLAAREIYPFGFFAE